MPQRRTVIKLGIAITPLAGTVAWKIWQNKSHSSSLNLIEAVIDRFVPADDHPGALDLGIDKQIELLAEQQPRWQKRLALISESIDKTSLHQHRKIFTKLSNTDKEKLLLDLLTDKQRAVQLNFDLNLLRREVMQRYYSTKTGQLSVGYQLPKDYPAYALQA